MNIAGLVAGSFLDALFGARVIAIDNTLVGVTLGLTRFRGHFIS